MPHRLLIAAVPGGADGRGEGGPAGGGVGQAAGKRRSVVVGMLAVVTLSVTFRGSRRLGLGLCTLFLQGVNLYIQLLDFFLIGLLLDEGACDFEEPVLDHHGAVIGVCTVDAELRDEQALGHPGEVLNVSDVVVVVVWEVEAEASIPCPVWLKWWPSSVCAPGDERGVDGRSGRQGHGRDIEVTTGATVLSKKWEGWEEDSGRERGT